MSAPTAVAAPEETLEDERDGVADEAEAADDADLVDATPANTTKPANRRGKRVLIFGVLPGLALLLAVGAGYLKWQDESARLSEAAAVQSVRAATDSTIAMLSYGPDTVDHDLAAAADRLTGGFRDEYANLVTTVVAPGAKQGHITAVATVPAASAVSATANHAVVLVFVNQTTTIGGDPATNTSSSVRVTLEKSGDRWLIAQFEPV